MTRERQNEGSAVLFSCHTFVTFLIEIVGRLDTITAPALDKTINEDIGDTKNLVLDVKGMEYISSAGLRVLLAAQKRMQKIGSMKITGVCEEVMEVFEMTRFADILVIE